MYQNKTIYGLIPARSGSKSIKDKNILEFRGKPLLAHSIQQALDSQYIDKVYLSTDSPEYAEIGKTYGAEVPFLRPDSISGDFSTDYEVFEHFLSFLKTENLPGADIYVHLRPTYPTRTTERLDQAIELFIEHFHNADSLRSVTEPPITPYKMWQPDGQYLKPLLHVEGIKEPYNMPRQKLPKVYFQNACIDMMKAETLTEKKSMTGDKILAFEMDASEIHDIDTIEDFNRIT